MLVRDADCAASLSRGAIAERHGRSVEQQRAGCCGQRGTQLQLERVSDRKGRLAMQRVLHLPGEADSPPDVSQFSQPRRVERDAQLRGVLWLDPQQWRMDAHASGTPGQLQPHRIAAAVVQQDLHPLAVQPAQLMPSSRILQTILPVRQRQLQLRDTRFELVARCAARALDQIRARGRDRPAAAADGIQLAEIQHGWIDLDQRQTDLDRQAESGGILHLRRIEAADDLRVAGQQLQQRLARVGARLEGHAHQRPAVQLRRAIDPRLEQLAERRRFDSQRFDPWRVCPGAAEVDLARLAEAKQLLPVAQTNEARATGQRQDAGADPGRLRRVAGGQTVPQQQGDFRSHQGSLSVSITRSMASVAREKEL